MAAEDADVVEHGGLLHEAAVEPQLRVGVDNAQRPCRDALAVHHQDVAQLVVVGIVSVDNGLVIHGSCVLQIRPMAYSTLRRAQRIPGSNVSPSSRESVAASS